MGTRGTCFVKKEEVTCEYVSITGWGSLFVCVVAQMSVWSRAHPWGANGCGMTARVFLPEAGLQLIGRCR